VCGRFTREYTWREIHDLLDLRWPSPDSQLPVSWNVAPTQGSAIAAIDADGGRRLRVARWGLVPSWAEDPSIGSRLINARAEGLPHRRPFAAAFRSRRCVVPVTSIFEWQEVGTTLEPVPPSERGDGPRSGGLFDLGPLEPEAAVQTAASARARRPRRIPKQPWSIRRADGAPLMLAGLWEWWGEPPGTPGDSACAGLRSFTIITTKANGFMQPIHDRMPVVLALDDVAAWLEPQASREQLDRLLAPAPEGLLIGHRVSSRVNRPQEDDPSLTQPIE